MIPPGWQLDPETPPDSCSTSKADRVFARRDGGIRLELNKTLHGWSGARINTRGRMEFTAGTLEFEAKLPLVNGAWVALWTMGDHWPISGEIDVVEVGMPLGNKAEFHYHHFGGTENLVQEIEVDRDWHRWSVDRGSGEICWSLDGKQIGCGGDAAPDAPHWLCIDLCAWAEYPPTTNAVLLVRNVNVSVL